MQPDQPIGVFDSGVGGLSILRALRAELPAEDFVYFSDAGHAPYGEKDAAFVTRRALAIAGELRAQHHIKALVVACNTATALAVHRLRESLGALPVVGVEPALKPAAALTRSGHVAVLATRGTLASAKFQALRASLRGEADFVLVPCKGLAAAIDADDQPQVQALARRYALQARAQGGDAIDTVVLGCTHYPFAADAFGAVLGPQVRLVEPGEPVARQTRRLLEGAGLLNPQGSGSVQWQTSGAMEALRAAAARWLGL